MYEEVAKCALILAYIINVTVEYNFVLMNLLNFNNHYLPNLFFVLQFEGKLTID